MAVLKTIEPDVVQIPDIGRIRYILGGIIGMVVGAGPLSFLLVQGFVGGWRWLVCGGLVFFLGGFGTVFLVSHVYIDRRAMMLIKRMGYFAPSHETRRPIEPKAVRLTLKRERLTWSCGDTPVNTLWLVQPGPDVKLASVHGSLNLLRRMSEELASFLGIEYYEDRLYRSCGAFTPQTGPGTNPTRTYPGRNLTVPLEVDENEEFDTTKDMLHELTERYEESLMERETKTPAGSDTP